MANSPIEPPRRGLANDSPHGVLGAAHTTLAAGLVLQGLAALASFLVIPMLVSTLGSARFGVLSVIISLGPWLIVLDTGLQSAMRLLVGEVRTSSQGRAPVRLIRRGYLISLLAILLNAALATSALVLLPVQRLFGAEGIVPPSELLLAIGIFAAAVISSSPGAVILGALEGVGRTVVSASLGGLGPIAALPLTVMTIQWGGSFVGLALIQGLAFAIPRYAALAYWRWRPSRTDAVPEASLRLSLTAQLALLAGLGAAQVGLAPVFVASMVGAEAAASFSLTWRLVLGAMIPMAVLTPLFTASLAAARGGGWNRRNNSDLLRLLCQAAAVGALAGVALVVLGPPVAQLLTRGQVVVSPSLWFAGGAYLLTTYVAAPLQAAFVGPRALRASVVIGAVVTFASVGLSFAFVPRLGAAGPLWAASLGSIVITVFWIAVWRFWPGLLTESHAGGMGARVSGDDKPRVE